MELNTDPKDSLRCNMGHPYTSNMGESVVQILLRFCHIYFISHVINGTIAPSKPNHRESFIDRWDFTVPTKTLKCRCTQGAFCVYLRRKARVFGTFAPRLLGKKDWPLPSVLPSRAPARHHGRTKKVNKS